MPTPAALASPLSRSSYNNNNNNNNNNRPVLQRGAHQQEDQAIFNTTQCFPSTMQPRRPLLTFSHACREGKILPFPSSQCRNHKTVR